MFQFSDYVEIAVLSVALLSWLIRLEAKVMQLEKDQQRIEQSVWDKLDAVQLSIAEMSKVIYRIEGKMDKGE